MYKTLKRLILKALALAMGIATLVLNILDAIEIRNSIILLSIGLTALALHEMNKKN